MHSVLAGFVEPGETLEECVAREVREEVGLEVTDIRYFGNQPWPFPHSLMLAFTAAWASGDIAVDGVEILRPVGTRATPCPSASRRTISIARRLLDQFFASRTP
jgi:NAD+ diphosphatase